jgi:hypothetical protein
MANLRDALILRDFTVAINSVGKVGVCPSLTLPEINLEMEDFRGGGMAGTVELPMGIDKLDFTFDLYSWDQDLWINIGYAQGAMNVPFTFVGSAIQPGGTVKGAAEKKIKIDMVGTLKSIKTDAITPGKQVKHAVMVAVNKYTHTIDGNTVIDLDIYANTFKVNGTDVLSSSNINLGSIISVTAAGVTTTTA